MSDSYSAQFSRIRISPGTRLNGIFEIDHPLASGGMGEVYKGHTVQTGDAVAIKMLRSDMAENEAALALFRKEASALHNLHHDAIVRYFVFTVEPVLQRPYLAMEFVEGQSLSDLLRQGPLTFEAARTLMLRVAAGLQAAHERGIIHRDVSPDNIIIQAGDVARAKIIDFGIARSTRLGTGTVIGSGFAGKYNYVSPEQLGLYDGDVGARSDIYSLGLVLVEALTGQAIDMGGNQADVVEKRRRVPDLKHIDLRIQPLIERMLQPNPADRPLSMAEVASWPIGARDARSRRDLDPSGHRSLRPAAPDRRRGILGRVTTAGALGVLLLGIGGAGYYVLQQREPPAPAPSPAPSTPRPNRADAISRYVNQYDGGECFFVTPVMVSETSASLEGFGDSATPFRVLDDAFKAAHGVEANIDVVPVNPSQCPAVTFLSRVRTTGASAPQLNVMATSLRSGQTLSGTIQDPANRQLELLLVDDDGQVHNLTRLLRSGTGGKMFGVQLDLIGTDSQPQLLMAIASKQPISALKQAETGNAAVVFPRVLDEAARAGQSLAVAAKRFRLEP